jgi:Peptidase family M28
MRNGTLAVLAASFVAVAWIVLAIAGAVAYAPPAPLDAQASRDQFSAIRAQVFLKDLVGDGIPHPMGNPHHDVVRDRILRHFRELGYQPEVQTCDGLSTRNAFGRSPFSPQNIVVLRPGTSTGQAVMVAAHYDSVPMGPGASDDGVGVATILEIARIMRALPANRNDVIFLISDGEEMGLLGAEGFARTHPLAKKVRVAINLEARGTSGRSLMFQTSDENAWLIGLYARQISRPTTSSLYHEVYKRLPNDTDFTVFSAHGMQGYNFAFIKNVKNYHTANDSFENADLGSLQHHGDNAWQLLRVLADADLEQHRPGKAIYTDVLGTFMIWWPADLNLGLAIILLAATVSAALIARYRSLCLKFRNRQLLFMPALLALGAGVGWILQQLPALGNLRADGWVERPVPFLVVFWLVPMLAVIASFRFTPLAGTDMWSAWAGTWGWWNVIGIVLSWTVPGMSYLFLLPGAIAAFAGVIAALLPRPTCPTRLLLANATGAIAAGMFWLPMQTLLYDAIGFTLALIYPIMATFLATTMLPFFCRSSDAAQISARPVNDHGLS